ncbi:MAG: tRNA lysidine(34) synthetase TilS [Clostridiales bacterium]|nr:tRNA lysidine(34) synthetase TilS [Clostridiales bacterium]
MKDKVRSTIERFNMLSPGDKVVVGVSGGADSSALLFILNELKDLYGIKLIAAHVNHCLRGEMSDGDEAFVRDMCERLGVECRVLRADIKTLAERDGVGLEECGRNVRYEFFNSVCSEAKIATAHTLSDKAETVLFNLTRGSALHGLCGIPPVRGNIIRPLIDCTRGEIEEFCNGNGIEYVTDLSNFQCDYSRNRIRLNVIPELKKINPSFEAAILRCTGSLAADDSYLSSVARELTEKAKTDGGYNAAALSGAHEAIRKRALAELMNKASGAVPTGRQIELVDGLLDSGGGVQLEGGVTASVKNGVLFFKDKPEKHEPVCWNERFVDNCANLPFGRVELKIVHRTDRERKQKINKKLLECCFDYGKICGSIYCRNKSDGDAVRLGKRNCTKSLKKLFNEKKLPLEERSRVVVICDDRGIVWVENFGCAQRCLVDENTTDIAEIQIKKDEGCNYVK